MEARNTADDFVHNDFNAACRDKHEVFQISPFKVNNLFLYLVFSLPAFSEIVDVLDVSKKECESIASHGKVGGEFGKRSVGLSYGAHTSFILLAFEQVNISKGLYKAGVYENDRSIYQVCKAALGKQYLDNENNFIELLFNEASKINEKGGLVVFSVIPTRK